MPCRLGLAIGSAPRHRRPYMNQLVYEALILHPKEEGEREKRESDRYAGREKEEAEGDHEAGRASGGGRRRCGLCFRPRQEEEEAEQDRVAGGGGSGG